MDIDEESFNSWKHHPVTKVYLRYLARYEADLMQHQLLALRQMQTAPDQFQLGVFKGECNAVSNLANLPYAVLAEALSPPEQEEKQQEDQS